jgi:hypothetical protein
MKITLSTTLEHRGQPLKTPEDEVLTLGKACYLALITNYPDERETRRRRQIQALANCSKNRRAFRG